MNILRYSAYLVTLVAGQTRQELGLPPAVKCDPPLILNPEKTACMADPALSCPPAIAPMHVRYIKSGVEKGCNCPEGYEQKATPDLRPSIEYICVCPGNQYQTNNNPRSQPMWQCRPCPSGQTVSTTDPTQCLCPAGQIKRGNQCVCAEGFQKDPQDETKCIPICDASRGQEFFAGAPGQCRCQERTFRQTALFPQDYSCEQCPDNRGTLVSDTRADQCYCTGRGTTLDVRSPYSASQCQCANLAQRQTAATSPFDCENCPAFMTIDPSDPTNCLCPAGQSKDVNGVCQCPNDQIKNGADCRCPQFMTKSGDQCLCPTGQSKDRNGICQCPNDQIKSGAQCNCPAGQIKRGDQCVCPNDQIKNGSQCNCPAGQIKSGDQCLCPTGQIKNGSQCDCPAGQIKNGAQCNCPAGQIKNGDQCTCPNGFVKNGSSCDCPRGQFKNSQGNCECNGQNEYQTRRFTPFECRPCPQYQTVNRSVDPTVCNCPVGQTKRGNECFCPAGQKKDPRDGSKCIPICDPMRGQEFDFTQEKCVCQESSYRQTALFPEPFDCEPCPARQTLKFLRSGAEADLVKCERILPAPPVHTNNLNMESVPGGTDAHLKRCLYDPSGPGCQGICDVYPDHEACKRGGDLDQSAFDSESDCGLRPLSIAPLDRLLNQMNMDDNISVKMSCYPRHTPFNPPTQPGSSPPAAADEYGPFKFRYNEINQEKLLTTGQSLPKGAKFPVYSEDDNTNVLRCGLDEDFKVELYDHNRREMNPDGTVSQGSGPRSLGYQVVTREQIQCLGQDNIKIHFEYDKRQTLAGADTCFDHEPYVFDLKDSETGSMVREGVEDNIPFTVLNVCNKQNTDRKRCYLYSYQVTLQTACPVYIKPKLYAKITFESASNLVVLPGDQILTEFKSTYSQHQDSVRIMPEIYSQDMPSPIRERYQFPITGPSLTRLPCDDRKVADTVVCKDYFIYCTDKSDRVSLKIQGAGEIWSIDENCEDFLAKYSDANQFDRAQFSWDRVEDDIFNLGKDRFEAKYVKDREFRLTNVDVTESESYDRTYKVRPENNDWFNFKFEIGHRLHSDQPRCYQGVYMQPKAPVCQFQCRGIECWLRGPPDPNHHKRVLESDNASTQGDSLRQLQEAPRPALGEQPTPTDKKLAGPDVSYALYEEGWKQRETAPMEIPTRTFATDMYWLPKRTLERFLDTKVNNFPYKDRRRNLSEEGVISGEISNGKATLSTGLEHLTRSHYDWKLDDKVRQDISPPAAIKIERLPSHGKVTITENDGTVRDLQVGDVVPSQLMSSFNYEQGKDGCSFQNESKCDDKIFYSTLSSWVGVGQEASATINLVPVSGPAMPPVQVVAPSKSQTVATPEIQELSEKETEEKASAEGVVEGPGGCKTYPPSVINALIGIVSALAIISISLAGYYMYAKNQKNAKKTAEEARKDFDAIDQLPVAEEK